MEDIKNLSLVELKKLQAQIATAIEKHSTRTRKEFLIKIQKMAAAEGLDAMDLMAEASRATTSAAGERPTRGRPKNSAAKTAKSGKKAPLPPLYWNPADARESWSGRGRRPNWVLTYLENGGDLESLKKQP